MLNIAPLSVVFMVMAAVIYNDDPLPAWILFAGAVLVELLAAAARLPAPSEDA